MSQHQWWQVFVATWCALALAGIVLFWIGKNGRRKRRLFLPYLSTLGLLFIGFTQMTMRSLVVLGIEVPFIVLITFVNWYFTQFCLHCGAMTIERAWWNGRPARCNRCGKSFDSSTES